MTENKNNMKEKNNSWYQLSPTEIFKIFGTDERGLTTKDAKAKLKKCGHNELKIKKQSSLIRFLLQFHNALLYILMVAATISFFLGKTTEAWVIIGVIMATAIIGFIQEGKAEAALEALKKMMMPECTVIRGGKEQVILTREVVPGDIVILNTGDRVPADLRLFSEKNLYIDEAMLTGESLPAAKNIDSLSLSNLSSRSGEKRFISLTPGDQKCICFSGTFVTRGNGKGIVVETGENTEIGKIATAIKETKKVMPPIMKKIAEFTKFIIIAVVFFSVIVFGLGMWFGQPWDFMFLATVGMMVAMIPEGLPAVLIAAFAIGATAMAQRKALIRRLPAAETLGCVDVICSDKTGTLTKNEMTVRRIYAGGKDYQVSGVGYKPKGEFMLGNQKLDSIQKDKALFKTLLAGYLCNRAELVKEGGVYNIQGDPTEGALKISAIKAGISEKLPQLDEIPFESTEQYMATLHIATLHQGKKENVIYAKGSPERILKMCHNQLIEGDVKPLRNDDISKKADEMAKGALRVLSMAYKVVDKNKTSISEEDMKGLTFLGLQGMIDPPREEAIESVKKCKRAGVRTIMMTGDHIQTAKAIAEQLGIGLGEKKAIIGEEINKMSDKELGEVVEKVSVYGRVSPEHKLKITKELQKRGHIVAVIGDGVNDAPALKTADIGIAMGIRGTEVSKEASDMILVDDNFANIEKAIEEGRHIFNNIWKVLLFLLPTNGGQGLVMAISILLMPFIFVFAKHLPIQPVQILWVNLIIAIACAITLIWESKEKEILNKPPRNIKKPLANSFFFQRVGIVSLATALPSLAIFGFFIAHYGDSPHILFQASTLAFTTLIFIQICYLFTARSIEKSAFTFSFFSNKLLLLGVVATLGLQVLIVYSYPLFGFSPFKTMPFPIEWWLIVLLLTPIGFFAVELEKLVRRLKSFSKK